MEEMLKSLWASGPIGAVLAWFMWVYHQDMRRMAQAINRMAQLDTLRLIASPHISRDVKEAAAVLLGDIQDAQKEEKGKP